MRPTLRPIQVAAREKIRASFRAGHKRILAVAPTGFGKTVLLADLIASHLDRMPGSRVLVLVHRRELLDQTREKLHHAGVESVGVIGAGASEDASALVQIATVQSLLGRDVLPPATMVIPDEAHHYAADEWSRVVAFYADAIMIGFTATPMRSDKTSLKDMFSDLVVCAQTRELMDLGWLCECDVFGPSRKTRDNSETPLVAYQKRAAGAPAIVFASSVADAYSLALEFDSAGFPAACIEGNSCVETRARNLERFKAGELKVLTNVFVLTEGFDAPRAEVCILARGCASVGAYLQMVGRVLRPHPDKERAMLLDLRGAVHKHGMPDELRVFGLDETPISGGEAPVKTCECGAIVPASAKTCPKCGRVFPLAKHKPDKTNMSKIEQADVERSYWVEQLNKAIAKGYKAGYAAYRFKMKFGRFPAKFWREQKQLEKDRARQNISTRHNVAPNCEELELEA